MLNLQQEVTSYTDILRAVIKNQIQQLIKQLQDEAGEEILVLSTCAKEGTLFHLGSRKGLDFLQDRKDIRVQFINYCTNGSAEASSHTEGVSEGHEHVGTLAGFHHREEPVSLLHWLEKGTPEKCIKRKHSISHETDVVSPERDGSPSEKVYADLQNVKAVGLSSSEDNISSVELPVPPDRLNQETSVFPNGIFSGSFPHNSVTAAPTDIDMSTSVGLIPGLTLPQSSFICPQVFAPPNIDVQQAFKPNSTVSTLSSKESTNILSSNPQLVSLHCGPVSHTPESFVTTSIQPVAAVNKHLVVNSVNLSNTNDSNLARATQKLELPQSLQIRPLQKPTQGMHDLINYNKVDSPDVLLNGQGKTKTKSKTNPCKKSKPFQSKDPSVSFSQPGHCQVIVETGNKTNTSKHQISLLNLPTTVFISDGNFKPVEINNSLLHVLNPAPPSNLQNSCVKVSNLDSKEKDKTKKTLSSKIKEITERIQKDETKHNSVHSLEEIQEAVQTQSLGSIPVHVDTSVKPACLPALTEVPVPTSEPASLEEMSSHNHDADSSKLKVTDVSRASHRKPKLPRFNIGVASDDEDNGEPQKKHVRKLYSAHSGSHGKDISQSQELPKLHEDSNSKGELITASAITPVVNDILHNLNVTIDDNDSTFAHFNLDELGDSILLNESITDIPMVTGQYGPAESQNKSLIETEIKSASKPSRDPSTKKPLNSQSLLVSGSRKEKKFVKCRLCPEKFDTIEELENHLETALHMPKKFKCDLCGRKFSALRDVERHRRIHTGEKPFTCDVCNKSFSRKDNLKSHKKQHFKNSIKSEDQIK